MKDLETYLIETVLLEEFKARDASFRSDTVLVARLGGVEESVLVPSSVQKAWRFDGQAIQPIARESVPLGREAGLQPIKEGGFFPLYREGIIDFFLDSDRLLVDHHYGPTNGHGASYRITNGNGQTKVRFLGIRWVNQG